MSVAERAPLTRERIAAACREQVEAVGLHELSLRAVARSLDVTAAALYRHVGNKREMVELIAGDAFEELAARFGSIDAVDPIDRLREQAVAYVDYARAHPELYRVMMRFPPAFPAAPEGHPPSGSPVSGVPAFDPATRAFEASLLAVVAGIDSGLLAPIDPIVAALTLFSAIHGLVEVLLMGLDLPEAAVDELIGSAVDTVLRGLAARRGEHR